MSAGIIASHYVATAAVTYASTVLADAPLAYWKLDEASGSTMADSSGNSHGGSYVASPTLGATGLVVGGGTSATLNGSTQYGDPTDSAAFDVTAITVEAWCKTTQTTGFPMLIGRDDSGSARSFQFRLNGGGPEFLAFIGVNPFTAGAGENIADGLVHHVVGTFDGTDVKIYVDGLLSGTTNHAGSLSAGLEPVVGARLTPSLFDPFNGTLGHVAIYSSALSAAQVAAHYAAGAAAFTFTQDFTGGVPATSEWVYNDGGGVHTSVFTTGTDVPAGHTWTKSLQINGLNVNSAIREATLTLTFDVAGTITFWRKASSESGFDFFRFFIDGTEQTNARISGGGGWARFSYAVAAGSHAFKFRYDKDSSANAGTDNAFVTGIRATGHV